MEGKQLDPLSPAISTVVSGFYLDTGRLDEALAEAERTQMLDPDYLYPSFAYGPAVAYREKGMFDKAIALYSKAQQTTQLPSSGLAITYVRMGRQVEARHILNQLIEKARTRYIAADSIAAVYVALGEKDEAFRWLERAYAEHSWGVPNIAVSHEFRPLRSDPRYADLLRRTGLDPAKAPGRRLAEKVLGTAENNSPAPPIDNKSIAVLPFANLSSEPDTAYFADGIQEEILTRLAKIADLKVISRTSTQRFKTAPKDLPEIAKQLGVANILEGTIQKAEGQVRVNVQLINARNDSHLWAEKYDRKLTDVFAVESEIAKAIADSLQAKLSGFEQRAIATRPTESADGASALSQRHIFFEQTHRSRSANCHRVFQSRDRQRSEVRGCVCRTGRCFHASLSLRWRAQRTRCRRRRQQPRKRSSSMKPCLKRTTHSGLVLALHDFDFAQSQKEFERAIELNPNYATAHHQFGNVNLSMIGEFDRAIAEGNRAVELDPLSLIINTDLGQDFMLARRYDEAIERLRKTLAMDPRFYYARWTLGECLQMKGQLTEAMAEYQKAAEITDDPMVMALLAQGYAKTGQRDKAL